jgi:holo-[acyl-carrier protein] synthase
VAVLGTGIDIVEVERLEGVVARRGERFLRRVFTGAERAYCDARARPGTHYAGRFAVKEAVLKALRTGWSQGIGWREVEVVPGAKGEPSARLTGEALRRAQAMGIETVHISISHTDRYAVASAVAEGEARNGE